MPIFIEISTVIFYTMQIKFNNWIKIICKTVVTEVKSLMNITPAKRNLFLLFIEI